MLKTKLEPNWHKNNTNLCLNMLAHSSRLQTLWSWSPLSESFSSLLHSAEQNNHCSWNNSRFNLLRYQLVQSVHTFTISNSILNQIVNFVLKQVFSWLELTFKAEANCIMVTPREHSLLLCSWVSCQSLNFWISHILLHLHTSSLNARILLLTNGQS